MSDSITPERQLADTVISVAAHVEAELEEALAEHRLSRPSFLVLDALERAEGHTLNQRELVSAPAAHVRDALGPPGPAGARADDHPRA